jgi:hypothetical protein
MDIINFLINNSLWFFGIAVVGFIAYSFIKFSKSITRPISREEIERNNFIKRMEKNINQTEFNWLYRGGDLIGKITHARTFRNTGNPHDNLILEMVIQPTLFWKISNPLAKKLAFQVNYGEYENEKLKPNLIENGDKLVVPSINSFNYYFGIYYDITIAREHQDIILAKDLSLTDLHNEKSVDFCKAQEMSIIGYVPHAYEMAKLEKEKQVEIEKKKGKVETI